MLGLLYSCFIDATLLTPMTYKIGIGAKFHRFKFVSEFCPNGTKKCPSGIRICPSDKISLLQLQFRILSERYWNVSE